MYHYNEEEGTKEQIIIVSLESYEKKNYISHFIKVAVLEEEKKCWYF